jgi:hypothetical protein
MTSYTGFWSCVDGPGWASESPQRVGPLCTNPVGPMRGPVQSVLSKESKHSLLLQNTILKRFNCFIDYLNSRSPNEQQICHKMLVVVSISLQFQSFFSPLRPTLPDHEFQTMVDVTGWYLTEILAVRARSLLEVSPWSLCPSRSRPQNW